MKRISLHYKDRPSDKPNTYTVEAELSDGTLIVLAKPMRGCPPPRYTLTKTEYGYVNENGCQYTVAKRDMRAKPFSVTYRSGIGEGSTETKFATLAELQTYVKGRWQGVDYIDGDAVFHGDYGHFYLKGCTLADLGERRGQAGTDEYFDWTWKTV